MTEAVSIDLRRLSTDELGRLYVEVLRKGANVHDSPIQLEWSSRPKAERMAALRLCREQAAAEANAIIGSQATAE